MTSASQPIGNRPFLIGLTLLSLLAVMWPTFTTMAQIWWRSDTFAHGLFVVPIALYLVYENRAKLLQTPMHTDRRALGVIVVLAFGWALATVIDVQVGQQLTAVSLVPALVWLLMGWPATKTIGFPLGFLLLAVPAGEGLIPILIEFTADFTTRALRFTGIPVFREGNFLIIPTGRWSVVTGCSGIRYLMATVTVALLYGYLNYRAVWRRVVFVMVAIAVSIIGNGFRAYGIVMIGHLSGMKYAVGADHLFYGWVFFGLVVLILFGFGAWWREPEQIAVDEVGPKVDEGPSESVTKVVLTTLLGLMLIAFWPTFFALTQDDTDPDRQYELSFPETVGEWQMVGPTTSPWDIKFRGATAVVERVYRRGTTEVGVYLGYYAAETRDAELINAENVLVYEKNPEWRRLSNEPRQLNSGDRSLRIIESELDSLSLNLITWRWFWIAGRTTIDPYVGKFYQALASFTGRAPSGAVIIVYTKTRGELAEESVRSLENFVGEFYQAVDRSLRTAEENQ